MENSKSRLIDAIEKKRKLSVVGQLHLEIERELKEFDSIVPYKYNSDIASEVYSPRLYYILQGTCSCIDAAMKLSCECLDVSPENDNIPCYLTALNNHSMLTIQKVVHRQTGNIFQPFDIPQGKDVPFWWTAYNNTKHKLLDNGVTKATLGSTAMATAGLLILLHIINYSTRIESSHLLDGNKWKDMSEQFQREYFKFEFTTTTNHLLDYSDKPYLQTKEQSFKSDIFYYPMFP